MKNLRVLPLMLACCLSWLRADDFTVDWYLLGHGGGTSVADEFSVSGTIGQSAAAQPGLADEFTVTGGFGAVTVLPTEGAPALAITITVNGAVKVHWPGPAAGWELRQSSDPGTLPWQAVVEPPQDDGPRRFILVTPATGLRVFRLFPQVTPP